MAPTVRDLARPVLAERFARELRLIAERRGWQITETYTDHGISGSKSTR